MGESIYIILNIRGGLLLLLSGFRLSLVRLTQIQLVTEYRRALNSQVTAVAGNNGAFGDLFCLRLRCAELHMAIRMSFELLKFVKFCHFLLAFCLSLGG